MELLLIASAAGTFLSIGLKISTFAFLRKADTSRAPQTPPPIPMRIGMTLGAIGCLAVGLFPGILYHYLPYEVHSNPFTASHIFQTLQLLLGTTIAFLIAKKILEPHEGTTLDTDWIYREGLPRPIRKIGDLFSTSIQSVKDIGRATFTSCITQIKLERTERLLTTYPAGWVLIALAGLVLIIFS